MNNRKNTKSALIVSVISMLLCVTMLVGSTFAWFTDNATTNVSSIVSGNLDIALQDASGASLEGKTIYFTDQDENIYWEPGCTYSLPAVYIQNNGDLAVKYTVAVSGIVGEAELLEVITWDINCNYEGETNVGHLAVGEKKAITISAHMMESAGNKYMGKTLSGVAITVFATQDTVESDSFGNQYDAGATLPDLANANIVSDASVMNTAGNYILVAQDNTLTFGNNSSVADGVNMNMGGTTQYLADSIKAENGQDLTLSNGTLVKTGTFGKVRLDTKGQDQVAVFENMTFADEAAPGHTGSSSNDTAEMIQICPNGGGTGEYVFRNCTFNNANVAINGMNSGAPVKIVFENCTFNLTGNKGAIEINGYYLGSSTLTVKDCTFNMVTTSNVSAVSVMNQKNVTISFQGSNTVNGSVADPAVYKLFSTTSVKVTNGNVSGADTVKVTGIATK